MHQNTLLVQLLSRFLKEKNMYSIFRKVYKKQLFIQDSNFQLNQLWASYLVNPNMTSKFNHFCLDSDMIQEFNAILAFALKPYCKDFLLKHNILYAFLKNTCSTQNHLYLYYQKNNIKKNVDIILEKQINHLINKNYTIFSLIHASFQFISAKESYVFWYQIDNEYRNFLKNILNQPPPLRHTQQHFTFLKRCFMNLKMFFNKLHNKNKGDEY